MGGTHVIYSLQNERFRLSASDMGAELTSFQDVRTGFVQKIL